MAKINQLAKLERQARNSAEFRRHKLGGFYSLPLRTNPDRSSAACVNCHMTVYVKVKPQPNEIDIAGQALALNCQA